MNLTFLPWISFQYIGNDIRIVLFLLIPLPLAQGLADA